MGVRKNFSFDKIKVETHKTARVEDVDTPTPGMVKSTEKNHLRVSSTDAIMRILDGTKCDTPNPDEYWAGKEFENLSDEVARSYCSSIFSEKEGNLHEKEREVPYDFITARKAKRFFKEDYVNLTKASINKEYIDGVNADTVKQDLPDIEDELRQVQRKQKKELENLFSMAFASGL